MVPNVSSGLCAGATLPVFDVQGSCLCGPGTRSRKVNDAAGYLIAIRDVQCAWHPKKLAIQFALLGTACARGRPRRPLVCFDRKLDDAATQNGWEVRSEP